MSRYRAILQCLIAAGACAAAGGAWAQNDGKIIFSSPKDASVDATLKEQLGRDTSTGPVVDPFKAPDPFMPKSSWGGGSLRQDPQTTQQQTPTLTARQRDVLQKKKDWVFVDPDDTVSGVSEEDIFNLKKLNALEDPDENLTPMERYYQKQFEKKKPKDDDLGMKKPDGKWTRLDDKDDKNDKTLRDKSPMDALMGRITKQVDSFQPDIAVFAPKKDKSDDSSASFNDPFSTANYGPDAPASAQQARLEVYKKLYGLTTDSTTTPATSSGQTSVSKAKADVSSSTSFYTEKAPQPILGSMAPTAPVAPGKPTMNTVAVKEDDALEKQNPLFISPSMKLPKRPF